MMVDLGKYAVDVLLAYGISLGLLAGIIALTWQQSRHVKAALEAAESRVLDTDRPNA